MSRALRLYVAAAAFWLTLPYAMWVLWRWPTTASLIWLAVDQLYHHHQPFGMVIGPPFFEYSADTGGYWPNLSGRLMATALYAAALFAIYLLIWKRPKAR